MGGVSKLDGEKQSFSPKIFQKSYSAVTAEYENGVFVYIKHLGGMGVYGVMFPINSEVIGRWPGVVRYNRLPTSYCTV